MTSETEKAMESFRQGLKPFRDEFLSIQYQFVAYRDGLYDKALWGRIVLSDLPKESAPPFGFDGDVSPCHLLGWTDDFPAGLDKLFEQVGGGQFIPPESERGIGLVAANDSTPTLAPQWEYNDRVQYWEDDKLRPYWARRLYWAGEPATRIVPIESSQSLTSAAAEHGYSNFEQLVNSQSVGETFYMGNPSIIEVFIPIRLRVVQIAYNMGTLKATVQGGLRTDWSKVKVAFHLLQNVNDRDPAGRPGAIEFDPASIQRSGRISLLDVSKQVGTKGAAKLLFSYKKQVSGDAFAVSGSTAVPAAPAPEASHRVAIATVPRIKDHPPMDKRKVFVVYGRNEKARTKMFDFLRAIGLDPTEWSKVIQVTGEGSPHNDVAIATTMEQAVAVVVLLTGDDVAKLNPAYVKKDDFPFESEFTPQARPNVLFEAGMAFGQRGGKVVFVQIGNVRPFSDIVGRNIVRLVNSPESKKALAQRLQSIGCAVDLGGDDWLAVDFLDCASPPFDVGLLGGSDSLVGIWEEFKQVLIDFQSKGKSTELAARYRDTRARVQAAFARRRATVFDLLVKENGQNRAAGIIANIEQCMVPRELDQWAAIVERRVPDELDCFDGILRAAVAGS